MIAEVPPIEVHGSVARCDGGGGALGHPAVFINLNKGVCWLFGFGWLLLLLFIFLTQSPIFRLHLVVIADYGLYRMIIIKKHFTDF